jgi:hypothetical protein
MLWFSPRSLVSNVPTETCTLMPNQWFHGSGVFEFGDRDSWQAVDDLFANTYYQRAWVVQEISVTQFALVHCSRFTLPWDRKRLHAKVLRSGGCATWRKCSPESA